MVFGHVVTIAALFNFGVPAHGIAQAKSPLGVDEPAIVGPIHQQAPREPRVTLAVKDSTIGYVIRAIAKQGNCALVWDIEDPSFAKRIHLRVANVTIMEAYNAALQGTGLVAEFAPDGRTVMVRPTSPGTPPLSHAKQSEGRISGRVVDSATGQAVSGATAVIQGTKIAGVTSDQGTFWLQNVPIGEHVLQVKLFGYKSVSRAVKVVDEKPVRVLISLVSVPTSLSGVVTTATGVQRKVEVGNDITRLNVDSIIRVMPISSVSDLLATRVPGMDVARTSGAPGAPSKIRIRGLTSINSTNDPIVIIDGVRVHSAQGNTGKVVVGGLDIFNGGGVDRSTNMAAGTSFESGSSIQPLVPSALDQIDPNSIATIDVLKGPSAVALYGSDAANGVIIITTKRGKVGRTQWNASLNFGTETMPGKWPTNYFMWGTQMLYGSPVFGEPPMHCNLRVLNSCRPDSLVAYQVLNNASTTALGRGGSQQYRMNVSGGNSVVRFSLNGSMSKSIGVLKIPDADVEILNKAQINVPDWQRRPQGNEQTSGTASFDIDVSPTLAVVMTSTIRNAETRTTPFQEAIAVATRIPPVGQPLGRTMPVAEGSGLLYHIRDFRRRIETQQTKSGNTVDFTYTPVSRIRTQTTVGYDYIVRNDRSVLDRNDCFDCSSRNSLGEYSTGQGRTLTTSITSGLSNISTVNQLLTFTTSAGVQYFSDKTHDFIRKASDLPAGATSGNGALTSSTTERTDDRVTAGGYIETRIGIGEKFFVPLAIRRDAGTGIGRSRAPLFPKLSFSYLVSDLESFDRIPILGRLSTLRIRSSYGEAGVQPSIGVKTRTYRQIPLVVNGIAVTTVGLNRYGNPEVKPERTREFEGGFEIELLQDRISVSMTGYNKYTHDALVTIGMPPSLGTASLLGTQANIGEVKNTGIEATVDTRILDTKAIQWSINTAFSRNRNVLVKMNSDKQLSEMQSGTSSLQRFVEGYPLNGRWARPVVGYTTADHYGIEVVQDVILGDSMVFLGGPLPKSQMSAHSTITLLNRLSAGIGLSYEQGRNQINTQASLTSRLTRGLNDLSIPLALQAYNLVADKTNIGFAQNVSVLRLNALSLQYRVPKSISRFALGGKELTVALQGTNLWLKTNYRGKDPSVSDTMNEILNDSGTIPSGRVWNLNFQIY